MKTENQIRTMITQLYQLQPKPNQTEQQMAETRLIVTAQITALKWVIE